MIGPVRKARWMSKLPTCAGASVSLIDVRDAQFGLVTRGTVQEVGEVRITADSNLVFVDHAFSE